APDAPAVFGYMRAEGPADMRVVAGAAGWFPRAAAAGCPQGHLGLGLVWMRAARDEAGHARAAEALRVADGQAISWEHTA
ncbi:MAG: hypothetical protein ABF893_08495, partial [Gluconacetobacter liquefaciens]